jgi:hypothetical protein
MGSGAYKPRKPFKAVEGMGEAPWMKLSRYAAYTLDRFYVKFTGYNRNDLRLSYSEMKTEMSNRLFNHSLLELRAFGFIEIVKTGRLERQSTVYKLSNHWRKLRDKPKILDEIEQILNKIRTVKRNPSSFEKRSDVNALTNKLMRLSKSCK